MKAMNEVQNCGFTDWTLNEMRSVKGTDCFKTALSTAKMNWDVFANGKEAQMQSCAKMGAKMASCSGQLLSKSSP